MLDSYLLPEVSGIEVARQIREQLPNTEVLIFGMHDGEKLVGEAMRAGARGYVLKSDRNEVLIAALRSLAKHRAFFSSQISESVLNAVLSGLTAIRPQPPRTPGGPAHRRETFKQADRPDAQRRPQDG